MCEWLLMNVFPTPREKAILISMIVSTILALVVVFINKWANDSREKKKHLILKLEEISKLTSEYSLLGMHYVQDGTNLSDEEKLVFNSIQSFQKVMSALSEIDALLCLNFSNQSFFNLKDHIEALKKHREEFISQKSIFALNTVSENHFLMVTNIRTGLMGLMSNSGYKTT
jgi:hypothetical protein